MTNGASFELDRPGLHEVAERLGLRMIVLFGSRATGTPPPGPDSDVDLAIAVADPRKPVDEWVIAGELAKLFPHESLDVVFMENADSLFRWEIVREGVLLFGDELAYLELRAFAYRDFIDSADLRALEAVLFERKLAYLRGGEHASA
jgi:predicted nucleotidyltransferase